MHFYRNTCGDLYCVEERLSTRPLQWSLRGHSSHVNVLPSDKKIMKTEFKLVCKTTFWKDLGLAFEELLAII